MAKDTVSVVKWCGVCLVWCVSCVVCVLCGVCLVWCVLRGVCLVWCVSCVVCVLCGVCLVWCVSCVRTRLACVHTRHLIFWRSGVLCGHKVYCSHTHMWCAHARNTSR